MSVIVAVYTWKRQTVTADVVKLLGYIDNYTGVLLNLPGGSTPQSAQVEVCCATAWRQFLMFDEKKLNRK